MSFPIGNFKKIEIENLQENAEGEKRRYINYPVYYRNARLPMLAFIKKTEAITPEKYVIRSFAESKRCRKLK